MRSPLCAAAFTTALCAFALHSSAAIAQASPSAADAFRKARALYYTPVDSGLQGFQCDVAFDWKQFIQKATSAPVPDDDARLAYLRSIKLTVADDLNGAGELHWTAPTTAPDASESSIDQIRTGMQQMWTGFFQSWNGFYNGELVSLTDTRTVVERTPKGFHLSVRDGSDLAEEDFGADLVMQSLHVEKPNLDLTMTPRFSTAPEGMVVSILESAYKSPPTAQPVQVKMSLNYALTNGFQLPSELLIDVAGTTSFPFHLNNCTVKTKLTQAKPAPAPAH